MKRVASDMGHGWMWCQRVYESPMTVLFKNYVLLYIRHEKNICHRMSRRRHCENSTNIAKQHPQPTKPPLGSKFLLRVLFSFMFFFLCIKIILLFNDIEQDFHSAYFYWIFNIKQKPYHQHRIFIKNFFLTHKDEGKRERDENADGWLGTGFLIERFNRAAI